MKTETRKHLQSGIIKSIYLILMKYNFSSNEECFYSIRLFGDYSLLFEINVNEYYFIDIMNQITFIFLNCEHPSIIKEILFAVYNAINTKNEVNLSNINSFLYYHRTFVCHFLSLFDSFSFFLEKAKEYYIDCLCCFKMTTLTDNITYLLGNNICDILTSIKETLPRNRTQRMQIEESLKILLQLQE